jgi:hypothetical protein
VTQGGFENCESRRNRYDIVLKRIERVPQTLYTKNGTFWLNKPEVPFVFTPMNFRLAANVDLDAV